MIYKNIAKGKFIERPNRFIALVDIDGKTETVHVKNTGRCRELLTDGATVYLETSDNTHRKTKYDLVAVEKQRPGKSTILINMDSQAPNPCAMEWFKKSGLFSEKAEIKPEVRFGNSRFDFFIDDNGRRIFVEVKGCTLEYDGTVYFPDAPTIRGTKHVSELTECLKYGYESCILFVIQMKEAKLFKPNTRTDAAFSKALKEAGLSGVKILAVDCKVTPNSIFIDDYVPIDLS